jgi:hypothetical protein
LLEGTGRFMRHVKLRPGQKIEDAALRKLVHIAYADMKRRFKAERSLEAPHGYSPKRDVAE